MQKLRFCTPLHGSDDEPHIEMNPMMCYLEVRTKYIMANLDTFFGFLLAVPGNRTSTITCGQQCNVLGTERTGTTNTGRLFCDCKPGVKGACCDECQENTFENPTIANCATCRCNIPGTIRCNKKDGSCTCRDGVEGKLCNRCKADYYTEKARDYSTCKPCTCHPDGSQSCDSQTGSCDCKPGVIGNDCDRCRDLFYPRGGNFDQCVACPCLAKGTQACTVSGKIHYCP